MRETSMSAYLRLKLLYMKLKVLNRVKAWRVSGKILGYFPLLTELVVYDFADQLSNFLTAFVTG